MKFRRPFFCLLLLAVIFPVQKLLAHSPFDSSSRVIVHADSVEVMVTVGSTLGENFLRAAQINPRQLVAGRLFTLDTGMAATFFSASADGTMLPPREADVIGDGVEFQFHFEYALAPAKQLRLESAFLPALPAPRAVPLVLTDENGNILGSAILSPGKPAADFTLPAPAPGLSPPSLPSKESGLATNPPLEKISTPQPEMKPSPSFGEFLKLGIGHILTGYDHLLFLLALLLGCRRWPTMLWVVTGFTLAHSVTLALAALGIVTIPPRIVEPVIAASIIIVAAENFRRRARSQNEDGGWKMEDGGGSRLHPPSSILHLRSPEAQRFALTCGFGLIHGFGFAGALRATGLAADGAALVKPLLGFNLGVEIGQLAVVAVALPLLLGLRKIPAFERRGTTVLSALIIVVAGFWLWQRIASLGD